MGGGPAGGELDGESHAAAVRGSAALEAAAECDEAARCALCGALGQPGRLAGTGARTTRCDGCRRPGDERVERPPWRRSRDAPLEAVDFRCSVPVVEDLIDDADLAALMEARNPAWPRVGLTDPDGVVWAIGGAGWNGLLRAAFSVLLPLQCAGQVRHRLRARLHWRANYRRSGRRAQNLRL